MEKKQIKLEWDDKTKAWRFKSPDQPGLNLMGQFFAITKDSNFIKNLSEHGYDHKTFTVTCQQKTAERRTPIGKNKKRNYGC
jgi:hypothetical protein